MGDHFYPVQRPRAVKQHICTYCQYPIPKMELYRSQSGIWEGKPQRNKFHEECWEDLLEEGGEEFVPGGGEPPQRIVDWFKKHGNEDNT